MSKAAATPAPCAHQIGPYVWYLGAHLTHYPELIYRRRVCGAKSGIKGIPGSWRMVRWYVAALKAQHPQRVYKPYETGPGEKPRWIGVTKSGPPMAPRSTVSRSSSCR